MTPVVSIIVVSAVVLAAAYFKPAKEHAFERELKNRPQLDDDAFYEKFYAGTATPKEIPIRLRQLYAEQLGQPWANVLPQDNPARVYGDLDPADLLAEVAKEFAVPFSAEEMQRLDGSFDSVVKFLNEKVGSIS
jgi:hypothetical protein